MASNSLPPQGVLRQLLRYEPETGKLFWLRRGPEWFASQASCKIWNLRFAEKEAFTSTTCDGYKQGSILGQRYKAHWLIWALVNGPQGKSYVDHINGDRADNRLTNLRLATHAQNLWNRGPAKNNALQVKGVYQDKRRGTWNAEIAADKCRKRKTGFPTMEAAVAARREMETEMHGKFAWSAP